MNSKVQTFKKSEESLDITRKEIVDFLPFECRGNVFVEVYA